MSTVLLAAVKAKECTFLLGSCLSLSFLLCWLMLCLPLSSSIMMADPISFMSVIMNIPVELKKKNLNVWTVNVINVVDVINVMC